MTDRTVSRREALRITAVAGISTAFTGAIGWEVVRTLGLQRVSEVRTRMGTLVTLTVVHPDGRAARALVEGAFAEMARLEALLSRHRPDTPVSRLNRDGVVDRPPLELVTVLNRATAVSEASDGAFDVTIAPLLTLYERAFERHGREPDSKDVAAALARVDYRALTVDRDRVRFAMPDMAISLDGIAKGFIVDRTIETLATGGAERILVDAGGDMSTAVERADGEPWRIGIQHPRAPAEILGVAALHGTSIATSGDYMRTFTEDRRLHHILDPRTGRSPTEVASVSVVASTAMDADVLSTAVMVLGTEAGIAMLDGTEEAEGLVVTKSGEQSSTPGFWRRTARG